MPKDSALIRLDGPMLDPDTRYDVLAEIELANLPPLTSINFLISFRSNFSKTPEITMRSPFKGPFLNDLYS